MRSLDATGNALSTSFLNGYLAMLEDLPGTGGVLDKPGLHLLGVERAQTWENPNTTRFAAVLDALPEATPSCCVLDQSVVCVGQAMDLSEGGRLEPLLRALMPWRKGPFSLFGVDIDTEWRSDMKWDRVAAVLPDLRGKRVLDIGCGSGYYMWRLAGLGPALVLGMDPSVLCWAQFHGVARYLKHAGLPPIGFFPFGYEPMVGKIRRMDVVLAMGVLYHQRSPMHFLVDLKSFVKSGGMVVLETIVIDTPEPVSLFPKDRYAKMRNVYFLPSLTCLRYMCERAGFGWEGVADVSVTTVQEQRRTSWVNTESLADFLDPVDPTKTIEGYPAPVRAVVVLRMPGARVF